jgi:hypothetical protein
MYNHYLRYCKEKELHPVNASAFGKMVRHVFPEIKNRRLGARGNSKRHYCGIRENPFSSQNPNLRHYLGKESAVLPEFPHIEFPLGLAIPVV